MMLDYGVSSRRRNFNFENKWLMLEGFVDQVKTWWRGHKVFRVPLVLC
jgi:hypothetical protein